MSGKFEVRECAIPDVKIIRGTKFTDARGFFLETYARHDFAALGIECEFVQDNLSLSNAAGTVRGLHFQIAPRVQAKLVRVLKGRILDVAVDLRRSSPSRGKHIAVELDAEAGEALFLPGGFAHAFCTLAPETLVSYKVDSPYSAEHERGIYFADPDLAIAWPVSETRAILSERDRKLPPLSAALGYFG
jgi:dTDP-4-dehydrorhamnose 3,5-epimerase